MSSLAVHLVAMLALSSLQGGDAPASPRAAARAYFEAVVRGDADAALRLVVEPSESDRLAVRATAASERALLGLEDLTLSRFGDRGGLGVATRHRRLLAALDRAPLEVKGDRAVLRPDGERPIHLRRVAGGWKVDGPAGRLTDDERQALQELVRTTEEAAQDLADRIRASAVKSAEEAREALRRALGKDEEGVPL
jgi:hypothetical protein